MSSKILSPKNGLTDTFIKNLKPQDKPYEVSDRGCKGLRLRVTAAGGKIFLSTIYINGKRKVFTLGHYPHYRLSDARKDLPTMKAQAKAGELMTAKEQKRLQAEQQAEQEKIKAAEIRTVEECLVEFERTALKLRKRPDYAYRVIDAEFRGNGGKFSCNFILADMPVKSVTQQHLKELVFSIKDRGSVAQAKKVMDLLMQFFRWCYGQGYIDALPFKLGTNYKEDWGLISPGKGDWPLDIEKNGKRKPGLPEISKLFSVLDTEYDREIQNIIKILLLTGVRSAELLLAKPEHIDLNNKEWFIPKEHTKTFNPNKPISDKNLDSSIIIPLSDYLVTLFRELLEHNQRKYIIHMGGKSIKAVGRRLNHVTSRIRENHKIGGYWTIHTLRKTFRSHISEWATFEIAERCLNHSMGKIAITYNKADDLTERRKVLERWSDYVYRCVYQSTNNVVQIA